MNVIANFREQEHIGLSWIWVALVFQFSKVSTSETVTWCIALVSHLNVVSSSKFRAYKTVGSATCNRGVPGFCEFASPSLRLGNCLRSVLLNWRVQWRPGGGILPAVYRPLASFAQGLPHGPATVFRGEPPPGPLLPVSYRASLGN